MPTKIRTPSAFRLDKLLRRLGFALCTRVRTDDIYIKGAAPRPPWRPSRPFGWISTRPLIAIPGASWSV